jgi:YjbE family integral membrane protein
MTMEILSSSDFWIGLVKIIWINIILSGDNAVVIALAARSLPAQQQRKAIMFGSGAAVVLRVGLTVVAARLLELPWLEIAGGLLLLWIGVQLFEEEGDDDDGDDKAGGSLMAAVRTILLADLVMSLDNVIAVAAAAQGSMLLLILGLAISIPLVIFGSTLMIKLMERFPVIVLAGAALIGWVAGETIIADVALKDMTSGHPWMHYVAAALGALLVVALGKARVARGGKAKNSEEKGD